MSKILSYAYTTEALLAGVKFRTRRRWSRRYALSFHGAEVEQAWNRSPRVGGFYLGDVQLTADPFEQRTGQMTEEDYSIEGLAWMEDHGLMVPVSTPGGPPAPMQPREFFEKWREENETLWVVDFVPVKLMSMEEFRARLSDGPGNHTLQTYARGAGVETGAK